MSSFDFDGKKYKEASKYQKELGHSLISEIELNGNEIGISFENTGRYFLNQDEMIKWIDQPCLVPFIAPLPDSHKVKFRDAVVETMIERTEQPDGGYYEPFMRLSIKAKK